MKIIFYDRAWDELRWWVTHEPRVLKRLLTLIEDAQRNPFEGIGKPEPLKGALQGWWSRRITAEHRLVYRTSGDELHIASCRKHYS